MEDIKQTLREIYVQALKLQRPASSLPVDHLVQELGIDSINSLEILIFVEDHFKIEIADQDLDTSLLDSLDRLSDYVQNRLQARTPNA